MAKTIPYCALLLSISGDDGQPLNLPEGITSVRGHLPDFIAAERVEHWRMWLGSIEWEKLTSELRFVVAHADSRRQHAGGELQLQHRAGVAWYALLLTDRVRPFAGIGRFVSGQAQSIEPLQLGDSISGFGKTKPVSERLYTRKQSFFAHAPPRAEPAAWLNDWSKWIHQLDRHAPSPPQPEHDLGLLVEPTEPTPMIAPAWPQIFSVALQAFEKALGETLLEFKIPEFVRAAECVLAVPKGQGGAEFVKRSMALLPDLEKHWYVGGTDLADRLLALYNARSECVHGKLPFAELRTKPDGSEQAARLECLGEALARGALRWAVEDEARFALFVDRTTLEKAWREGRVA